jgi:hypothetical protein
MATQLLDTELDVCRKYLHFSQRDLYWSRFGNVPWDESKNVKLSLKHVKYWRMRYNAAMAIEQSREVSRSDLEFFND